jgi:hypothetical protein
MSHLHRNVILAAIVAAGLVAGAYAAAGIGLVAIVVVGLFGLGWLSFAVFMMFEEETHLPWREETHDREHHGYHAAH